MRISTLALDSGYTTWRKYRHCKIEVYLNDVLVRDCITADDELGEVVVPSKDEHGCYIIDHTRDDIVLTTHVGHVRIKILTNNLNNDVDSNTPPDDTVCY